MATRANFSHKKQQKQSGGENNLNSAESNKIVKQVEIKNAEEWEKQIWYWRSHLDVFIEEYLSSEEKPISLYNFQ